MFKKVNQLAEQAATNISRRHFLGRFGRAATTAAAAVGAIAAFPGLAFGGRKPEVFCGPSSQQACLGKSVGDRCGSRGKCAQYKGSENCYCSKEGGGGGGGRGGGKGPK